MKRLTGIILLLFALLAIAAYTQRGKISDALVEWKKADVEEVVFEDIGGATTPREEEEADVTEDVEIIEDPAAEIDSETQRLSDSTTSIPAEYNLAIPFTSQAPYGNWEMPYKEACEEASALMAAFYYDKQPAGQINADTAEQEIQKIVAFEESFFGYSTDTTAEETALVLESYYHLGTELVTDPAVEDIKAAIAAGYPVIVPAAGRQLGNPNFTPPGPLYHMLVIKGYTEDAFITNDPGTRHGQNYTYDQDVLMNAIHDWNDGAVETGAKVIIIVKP